MIKLFNDKGFWKNAIRLTIPVALQNLLTSSFTLADTLLVSSLGTVALSSVGMIGQWAWLSNMILIGFCSATTVFVSQYWGIRDYGKIRRIAGISIIFAFLVSLSFTIVSLVFTERVVKIFNSDSNIITAGSEYLRYVCLSYIAVALTNILGAVLRCVENVKMPMYVSLFTTALNIFLDYSMIFGKFGFPNLGIKGAAIATSVSAWSGVGLMLLVSVFQKNILISHPKNFFSFSRAEVVEYVRKAAPVVINEGMWGAGTFVFNVIFANMGYVEFSALTIVRSFESFAFVLFIGICSASSVMIGKSIGNGKIERAVLDSKRFSIIVPAAAIMISLFIGLFRNQLVGIFNLSNNVSAETLSFAALLMLIYAFAFPLRMMPYLQIVSIFRSGGDTATGAKFELFCLWALSVPATLMAVYLFKVPFAAAFIIMYVFEDIPKNIMCTKYYFSKKWIRPVTEKGKAALNELEKE